MQRNRDLLAGCLLLAAKQGFGAFFGFVNPDLCGCFMQNNMGNRHRGIEIYPDAKYGFYLHGI